MADPTTRGTKSLERKQRVNRWAFGTLKALAILAGAALALTIVAVIA